MPRHHRARCIRWSEDSRLAAKRKRTHARSARGSTPSWIQSAAARTCVARACASTVGALAGIKTSSSSSHNTDTNRKARGRSAKTNATRGLLSSLVMGLLPRLQVPSEECAGVAQAAEAAESSARENRRADVRSKLECKLSSTPWSPSASSEASSQLPSVPAGRTAFGAWRRFSSRRAGGHARGARAAALADGRASDSAGEARARRREGRLPAFGAVGALPPRSRAPELRAPGSFRLSESGLR